jgi:hypothetical protein
MIQAQCVVLKFSWALTIDFHVFISDFYTAYVWYFQLWLKKKKHVGEETMNKPNFVAFSNYNN